MTTNNRYFIGTLDIKIGEYSNQARMVIVANSSERAWHVLDRAAASYYGSGDEEYQEYGYEANDGEICTSAHGIAEIGLAAFTELRSILTVRTDDNIGEAFEESTALTEDGFKALARSTARSLEKRGIEASHSRVLEALSAGFGQKNWQVLHTKLGQLEALLKQGPLVVKPLIGSVEVPELDTDAFMLKRHGTGISPLGRLERRIVANLFAHLEKNGFRVVAIDDTDDENPVDTSKAAMELIFDLDTAYVHISPQGGDDVHIIHLEIGNGIDLIVNYTFNEGDADGFEAVMQAFDAEAFA